jgi:type VI secretion system secreted protein VgrG
MAHTQDNRHIAITTPLGKDVLLLKGFSGHEALSQLFSFDLDLLSEVNAAINFDDVVGKNVTITIRHASGARFINGIVRRFSAGEVDPAFAAYRAEMVPWLWLLTQTSDCRIFQNKSVPDIITQIFRDLGFTDFKLNLVGTFEPREYCVQYRETDFNFVSRLMEQYGIFYYFEHVEGKHTLVLANKPSAHQAVTPSKVRYQGPLGAVVVPDNVVTAFTKEQEVRPSKYALTDYNFETPSVKLAVNVESVFPAPTGVKFEVYDYPGEYAKRNEGDALVRVRMEEEEVQRVLINGDSNCAQFTPGFKVDLTGHARPDFDASYVLLSISHTAVEHGYDTGRGEGDHSYTNTFTCIPAAVPFRPPRVTPRPLIQGSQTAEVVGPKGEEIYTDKHGRVKVQFHWDREGKKDENSSCWIRVSHPWAGKGWGSVSIPRIGQEVIIDFLEGDPDQPIVTGRVYNGELMPPYGLPAGGNVSGLKSNSTPGSGGYNEISMNDSKGKEKMTVHAQYDLGTTVEHDESHTVVTGNRKIDVQTGTHTETIKGNTTITILTGTFSHDVQTGTATYHAKGAVGETYDATQTTTVAKEIVIESTGASVHVKGSSEVKLSSGTSFILVGANGTIQIHADNVEMIGTKEAKMGVGTQNVTCNNQKVEVNGAGITSSAVGVHEISGAMIKLN